jgi:hypothetical protein
MSNQPHPPHGNSGEHGRFDMEVSKVIEQLEAGQTGFCRLHTDQLYGMRSREVLLTVAQQLNRDLLIVYGNQSSPADKYVDEVPGMERASFFDQATLNTLEARRKITLFPNNLQYYEIEEALLLTNGELHEYGSGAVAFNERLRCLSHESCPMDLDFSYRDVPQSQV